jgi:hypothetical protein
MTSARTYERLGPVLPTQSRNTLEAPTYPPADTYEPPVVQPYTLRLENVSLAELMKMPQAWDIVLKHLPSLKLMAGSAMMKPHLGNFTVLSVQTFVKTATPEDIAAIDEELSRLPPVQEAAP